MKGNLIEENIKQYISSHLYNSGKYLQNTFYSKGLMQITLSCFRATIIVFGSLLGIANKLLSSKIIKSKIADLISKEDKENPLSDQKIVDHLQQDSISISRRTIAKYRSQLKTLASKSRRE